MGTLTTIKTDERQMEQFNDIMANVKPFATVGSGKRQKVLMGSAVVPLSCCYIDERYQGLRQHKNIRRLETKWDPRKLGPITLVPHPEEYRFAVVDGQGRCVVAPKKGLDRLNAVILMDAPKDKKKRLKFEAEYFIGQDSEVENVKPVEKHLARVIIGDEAALTLDTLFKKYKIKFVNTKGQREGSVLGSYTDTYNIARIHGASCLDFIFSVISRAGWDKETNGYSTAVMRALREIWVAHPNDRPQIHNFLSEKLRQMDPTLFTSRARVKYPTRDHRVAGILYIEDLVCSGLHLEKRIYISGQKYKTLN